MLMKPDSTANSTVATACGNCGVEDRLLIHHVRHRGIFRRLCTNCVLRLHPQAFCPTCFQVYPPSPSNDALLSCAKCYSSSHSHCVASPPPSPYICPLCVTPNAPLFKLKTAKEANVEIGEGSSVRNEERRVLDADAAKKLLAAAKIASSSMNKAAVAAKAEAERRAKEAAFTRKRAMEALEHVAYLVMKEKLRKEEAALAGSGEATGSGLGGVAGGIGYASGGFNIVRVKRENNVNACSNTNGIAGNCVSPPVIVEEKINAVGNVDRVDNSNQVVDALNAVELRENEKMSGMTGQGDVSGVTPGDGETNMEVDEKGGTMVSDGENVGGLIAESDDGSGSHHTIGAENINMQGAENSNNGEQHANADAPQLI